MPLNLNHADVTIDTPTAPPAWALMERELIRAQTRACETFFAKYFDERGYLKCIPRWGGNDGPDDAIENLWHWPALYVLGGSDSLMDMCKLAWEGHLRQYTEAKTTEVPFARDGMYYKEFPVMFDWVHNAEGLTTFNHHGLFDPYERSFEDRVRRFAGFYMDEDPQAPNYDPEHKIIRSLFNGSRGPLLRKATAIDWAGDPLDQVEGRFVAIHGERNWEEMLEHFADYTDIIGDHPQNLVATALGFNAYVLTGEAKYRDWVLEYVDAWCERAGQNDGILPSNIGLDGTIGGACDGKWYGGCYGWSFTISVPPSYQPSSRNSVFRSITGFGNALLLTGDQRYVDVWRGMLDSIESNKKIVDGQEMFPHMYGDDGWYDFSPSPYSYGALSVFYWSMDRADLKRLSTTSGWTGFLEGNNPDFPTTALVEDFEVVRRKMEWVNEDASTTDTRLSDNPNKYNPATVSNLIHLMLGGVPSEHSGPLHCRVRYFDPGRQRAGLPEDVGALVEKLGPDSMTLRLVNLNQSEERELIVQGGAYGEHEFVSATTGDDDKVDLEDGSTFRVRLAPGAGGAIEIEMKRYARQPTFAFPWDFSAESQK
jgi:hypothetical protein